MYTWSVRNLKRENEVIVKSTGFLSGVGERGGKRCFVVGLDKGVKVCSYFCLRVRFCGGWVLMSGALRRKSRIRLLRARWNQVSF